MCFYKRWFCLRSTSDLDQAWKTTIFTTLSSTKWKETVLSGWMMFHIVSTHINSGLQLMERDPAAVTQHLSADVLADGSRSYRNQLNKLMRMSHCCSDHLCWRELPLPSRWSSMLVFSKFLARATSLSVALVQRDILRRSSNWIYHLQIHSCCFHEPTCVCGCIQVVDEDKCQNSMSSKMMSDVLLKLCHK